MQIVIDIPEDKYFLISHDWWVNQYSTTKQLFDYIKNSTPLPKGHGRLIDAELLRRDIHASYSDDLGILEHIDNAPTVLEADKEVE